MNFLIIAVYGSILFSWTSAAATGSDQSVDKEKLKETAKQPFMECKLQTGASDNDLESVKMKKMPETHEGLCMLECVFEKSKLMKDGKFTKDSMVEGFKPVIGDDKEKMTKVENLGTTCEKEIADNGNNGDKCEIAKLLIECVVKNGKSHGLAIPTEIDD